MFEICRQSLLLLSHANFFWWSAVQGFFHLSLPGIHGSISLFRRLQRSPGVCHYVLGWDRFWTYSIDSKMSFSLNQNPEFSPRRSEFMFLKLPLSIIGELVRRKKELVVVAFKFGIFVYPNHRILFHCLRTNFVLSFNQSYPCWVMYCIGQNWCFLSSLKLGTSPNQEGLSPGMMEKFYWLNELKIAWWGRWRLACFHLV